MLIKPNWEIFKAKFSENRQENFEWFCYLLFSKEFNQPYGTHRYKNQSGIETDPIEVDNEVIGWQSKFYEDTLSNHKEDLLGTLIKTKRDNPNITKIILYTNSEWGQGQGQKEPKAKIETEEKAKKLNIELIWRVQSYFESPFVCQESRDISNYFFELEKKWELSNLGFRDKLHSNYQNKFKTISLLISDKQKQIEDIYINLTIIKDKEEEQKSNKKLISREAFLSSYEEIHKPKESIEIKDLIHTSKKSLIYGKAGIGKTTLCKYISYMWAKGELYQEFNYIIYISLRGWKNKGLKGAIKDNYYSQDDEDISLNIKENSQNILFLFDGYDELKEEKKKDLQKEIDTYALTHYIITSRPYGYQQNDFSVDEHFETIGFTDENVENYIDNFFEDKELQNGLKEFLQNNISIKHITYIPLMLEMICSLWEEKFKTNETFNSSMTMTEIYSNLIEYILKKHSANKDDESVYKRKNRKKIQTTLGKIAFEGLTKQSILFDGNFIEEIVDDIDFFEKNVINSGFLKSDRREKDMLDNTFEFPHLTFQEYFSALYVSKLSKDEQSEIIRDWKFYPHMQMFFAFLGGLIEDKEFLFVEIETEPRDLVGFSELFLEMNLIGEVQKKDLEKSRIIEFQKKLISILELIITEDFNYENIFNNWYLIIHILEDKVIKEIFDIFFRTNNDYLEAYIYDLFHCLSLKHKEYIKYVLELKTHNYDIHRLVDEKNVNLLKNILTDLDKIPIYNNFILTAFYSFENEINLDSNLNIEIKNIFDKYNINNIFVWYKENKKYIQDTQFIYIQIKSEQEYFFNNSKNQLLENSLQEEYSKIVKLLKLEQDLMIPKLIAIIKNKNFNWLLQGELIFLLEEILINNKKYLTYLMIDLWNDANLHDDIRENAIKSIYLNNYDNNFIEQLVYPYKKEKNSLSKNMIKELAIKLAEISQNNFYGFIFETAIINIDELEEADYKFIEIYMDEVNINVLFKAYDKGYNVTYFLYRNILSKIRPLYIKSNKLCTIEQGKEISTKRNIDKETLNTLQTLIKEDNLND